MMMDSPVVRTETLIRLHLLPPFPIMIKVIFHFQRFSPRARGGAAAIIAPCNDGPFTERGWLLWNGKVCTNTCRKVFRGDEKKNKISYCMYVAERSVVWLCRYLCMSFTTDIPSLVSRVGAAAVDLKTDRHTA